jgi:hypothetical protein
MELKELLGTIETEFERKVETVSKDALELASHSKWSESDQIKELQELLRKVEAVDEGTPELDQDFATVFASAPPDVTRSIDSVVRLIESELPGWWWTCGYCKLSNDASLYVPGSKRFPYRYAVATMAPDHRTGPEARRLLEHPELRGVFADGFHRDRRVGTVPLAMLAVFLEAKIALTKFVT